MEPSLHARAHEEVMAEIEALKKQIHCLEAVAAYHREKAASASGSQMRQFAQNGDSSPGSPKRFSKMGQREAAEVILKEAGRPLKASDIADRLMAGGYPSDTTNLRTSLFTSMTRAPQIFKKVGPGLWTLTDSALFDELKIDL